MKLLLAVVSLLLALADHARAEEVLRPVADPKPVLEDLQRKMSSLKSV